MLGKRGFSFVYILVFAIVSVSAAIVILLSYSIVSDTPINELIPDSIENFINPTGEKKESEGGFLGNLFGNKKSTGGGSSSGGTTGTGGTAGNPPNNTNQTHLACVNNTCAIVNGSGVNECSSAGVVCNQEPPIVIGNAENITPGNGWQGLTATPSANGVGPTPIGRWDFVPYQTLNNNEEIGIGIVAFHIYGIEKVLFAVEGGNWSEVREMTYNPYSRVWEYWVRMRASDFENDGLQEVRAIIYPKIGQPRVLQGNNLSDASYGIHSMIIYTNEHNTLPAPIRWVDSVNGNDVTGNGSENNPFKTIYWAARSIQDVYGKADGGIIYLKEGNHFWGKKEFGTVQAINTEGRWLNVKPAPGLTKNEVRINNNSASGLKTRLVHFDNIYFNQTQVFSGISIDKNSMLWVENSLITENDPANDRGTFRSTSWDVRYVLDSEFTKMLQACGCEFSRGVYINNLGGDAFINPKVLINARVEDLFDVNPNLTGSEGDTHKDIVQFQSSVSNVVLYGLKGTKIEGQYLFAGTRPTENEFNEGVAVVNYLVDSKSKNPGKWGVSTKHFLVWNSVFTKGFIFATADPGTVVNITYFNLRNSVFGKINAKENVSGDANLNPGAPWAFNNHYIGGNNQYGVNYTTGSSLGELFVRYTDWNSTDNDFHPSLNSILRGTNRSYVERIVPADLEGTEILGNGLGAIGALQ